MGTSVTSVWRKTLLISIQSLEDGTVTKRVSVEVEPTTVRSERLESSHKVGQATLVEVVEALKANSKTKFVD